MEVEVALDFVPFLNHSCCNPDSGKCYDNLSRHSWQTSEHDGLLGAGAFPRLSGCLAGAAALIVREKGCVLHRSDEPYRPPRPYKVCLILNIFSWQCSLNTQQLHVKSMNLGNNLAILISLFGPKIKQFNQRDRVEICNLLLFQAVPHLRRQINDSYNDVTFCSSEHLSREITEEGRRRKGRLAHSFFNSLVIQVYQLISLLMLTL